MDARPQARWAGIIVENRDDHVVVVEVAERRRHVLDGTLGHVWLAANGEQSVAEIAFVAGVPDAAAVAALDQLQARGLMVPEPIVSRF